MRSLRPFILLLLALSACAAVPALPPTPAAAVPTAPAVSPTGAPSPTTAAATATIAPSATPDPPTAAPSATPDLRGETITAENVSTLAPLRTIGLGRAVQATIAHDNALLAVATTAGVALLRLPAVRLVRFDPLPGGVERVALSPSGARLALVRVNPEVIELRRVNDGALLASTPGRSLAWSPDGALFAAGSDGRADTPAVTTLWRSDDGAVIATLPGTDPLWSPDGSTIATTIVGDGNVSTRLQRFDGGEIGVIQGGDVRFSPDGQLVAATVFPLADFGPQTGVYRAADAEPAFAVDGALPTFSPDGKYVAVAKAREVFVYGLPDGKQRAALQPDQADPNVYGNPDAIAIAFSSDGATLRAAVGGDLYAWSIADGKRLNAFKGLAQRGGQPDATFGLGGDTLISRNVVGDADCGLYTGLRVVNAADGSEIASDDHGVDAAFSDDGTLAAIVSNVGAVRLVPVGDARQDDLVAQLPGYGALAFEAAGVMFAASQTRSGLNPFGPSSIDLYDITGGAPLNTLGGGALIDTLTVISDVGEPTSLAFKPRGSTLLAEEESACDFVYQAKQTAWDLGDGSAGRTVWQVPEIAGDPYPQAASLRAFNPVNGAGAWADERGVVRLALNGVTETLQLDAPATALLSMPTLALLAVGDERGTVRLFNAAGGAAIATLQAGASVRQFAYSDALNGALLAARRADGRVLVWNLVWDLTSAPPKANLLATIAVHEDDEQLSILPASLLLIASGPGGVTIYSIETGRALHKLDVPASYLTTSLDPSLLAVISDERITLWGIP